MVDEDVGRSKNWLSEEETHLDVGKGKHAEVEDGEVDAAKSGSLIWLDAALGDYCNRRGRKRWMRALSFFHGFHPFLLPINPS